MHRGGTFSESNLTFQFDKTWRLKKYDAHFYYQILGSAGLRGVDFLAIHGDHLYLMEVKNYCLRDAIQSQASIYRQLEDPEGIAGRLHEKVVDTIRGIHTIYQVLWRKRLYRMLEPTMESWPAWLQRFSDWWFWSQTSALAAAEDKTTFVVWLETDPSYPDYPEPLVTTWKAEIERILAEKTRELPLSFRIANRENPLLHPHLSVLPDQ